MMNGIIFMVQGSATDPYKVTFSKEGKNLTAFCTCPAGQNGQYCKHRFRILAGDPTGITSNNLEEVNTVASWLAGTDVEVALKQVKEAELVLRKAEMEVSKLKKILARAMRN
jgi:hypothetical protein